MKKANVRVTLSKKPKEKIDHTKTPMKTYIPAGMASAQPPLGSMLGQRHINVQNFCSTFNELTKSIRPGIPIPTSVTTLPDNKFQISLNRPPTTYLLKQAAGLKKARYPGEKIAGMITVKHLYEIAKVKSEDYALQLNSVEQICEMFLNICRVCGIKVVHSLDAKEYGEFLKQREERYKAYKAQVEELKQAKLQRTKL